MFAQVDINNIIWYNNYALNVFNSRKNFIERIGEYMEEEDVKAWAIVHIRGFNYLDTNSLSCNMKGRPFIIYKVKGHFVYLFSIRTSNEFSAKEFYYPITLKSKKVKRRKCFVNLRHVYAINKDVLIQKVSALKSDLDDKRNSRVKYLATEYRNGILKEIDKLCLIEEYKDIITQVENGKLHPNMFVEAA